MKAKEIHQLTNEELKNKLNDLKSQLFYLRFNHAVGQLSNPKQLTNVKRDIARVKTVLREREIKGIDVAGASSKKNQAGAGK